MRTHAKSVMHKLGQPDRTGAVVAAVAAGILQVSGRDEGLTRLGEDVPGR